MKFYSSLMAEVTTVTFSVYSWMYHEHKKEAADRRAEALNLEAASQEVTNNNPPDGSSIQMCQNGTVTNGAVESETNRDVSDRGVENKACVVDERD
jgi:hypothetical protein